MSPSELSPVPLTVKGGLQFPDGQIYVGGTNYQSSGQSGFWFVVVDQATLKVAANVFSTDTNSIPGEVQPFVGQTGNMLIFVTVTTQLNVVPQGALYDMLNGAGAGSVLERAEQINETVGTGSFGNYSYNLVATLGDDGLPGFEELDFWDPAVTTLSLLPVTVDGQTTYTPVTLH